MNPPALSPPARKSRRGPAAARERLAAVGFMASLVGHTARNRLALVRAGLELLSLGAEDALTPEHRAELLVQLDRFLGDFNLGVDMVRCDFGFSETGLLRGMVGDAVETFRPHADAAGLTLDCAHGAREPDRPGEEGSDCVELDRRLLRMVILNLLRNAQEAGAKTIRVRTAFAADHFSIEVQDDGPGIPPVLAKKLMRGPITGRSDGTGLGLILCRDAVATMNGRIRLLRSVRGARFELRFPL